jgi:hypothetical protein
LWTRANGWRKRKNGLFQPYEENLIVETINNSQKYPVEIVEIQENPLMGRLRNTAILAIVSLKQQ